MPIIIGKWLICLLILASGQRVVGYDQNNPVDIQLSPPNHWINSLTATAYDSGVVGVYNALPTDGSTPHLYLFRLEDDVSWYGPFWPALDMRLTGLTVTETNHTLTVCGWHNTELHCWRNGTLRDEFPYFEDFEYDMIIGQRVFIPMIRQ